MEMDRKEMSGKEMVTMVSNVRNNIGYFKERVNEMLSIDGFKEKGIVHSYMVDPRGYWINWSVCGSEKDPVLTAGLEIKAKEEGIMPGLDFYDIESGDFDVLRGMMKRAYDNPDMMYDPELFIRIHHKGENGVEKIGGIRSVNFETVTAIFLTSTSFSLAVE